MLNSEAIAILQESNSSLLQTLNRLQEFPPETIDRKLREKYNYTLKKALREMEAVDMAIKALRRNAPDTQAENNAIEVWLVFEEEL